MCLISDTIEYQWIPIAYFENRKQPSTENNSEDEKYKIEITIERDKDVHKGLAFDPICHEKSNDNTMVNSTRNDQSSITSSKLRQLITRLQTKIRILMEY